MKKTFIWYLIPPTTLLGVEGEVDTLITIILHIKKRMLKEVKKLAQSQSQGFKIEVYQIPESRLLTIMYSGLINFRSGSCHIR